MPALEDKTKYIHDPSIHNLKDSSIIVPELVKIFNPDSVVDFGCGVGTFLRIFKREGIKDVLGIDGEWVNKELLLENINNSEFIEQNLEENIELSRKYDLVVSLEVAEHLSESKADTFVNNLVDAGKIIVFSAAIPGQGGQNHLNEQYLSYWVNKFKSHNYVLNDILRPMFWNNENIFWWYRQNIVVFAHESVEFNFGRHNEIKDIVHYELFEQKNQQMVNLKTKMKQLENGDLQPMKYLKLLVKSIFKFLKH